MLRFGIMRNFNRLEAYRPFHPELTSIWRAGVTEALFLFVLYDLRFSCSTPLHVDVAVALVVCCGHFQVNSIVHVGIKAMQAHEQCWEQSPGKSEEHKILKGKRNVQRIEDLSLKKWNLLF